jgi:tetratricopeptide (TPR) repeat protein
MTSGGGDPFARARALAEAGDLAGAAALYEQLFEFSEASRLRERAADLAGALRDALEAGDAARTAALRTRLAEEGSAADLGAGAAAYERKRAYGDAAELLEMAGELERAAELWARALEPARAGRLLESLGRYREAGQKYEEHLAQHPDDALVALHLGRILSRFGLHDRAIPYLQRAQRAPAHAAEALEELVVAFAAAGMGGAAEAAYRTLRDADRRLPPDVAEFLRARASTDLERTRADDERWLVGRYKLVALIGSGGMGRVWRALDDFTGEEVAVKVFAAAGGVGGGARGGTGEAFERFMREARIVKALGHPNVVAVREFNAQLGFIVMELMVETLEDRLVRLGALPGRQAPGVLLPVCAALEAAHQRGIIHRDIKPANVFFGAAGEVKLGDFGVAHLQELGATQTGSFIGTLAYMAPEQVTGAPLTFAADLYALGVTAFRLLTGRLPFETGDLATAHLSERPPRLAERGLPAPPAAEALVARMLAKDPGARHPSIAALRADIGAVDWRFGPPATVSGDAVGAEAEASAPEAWSSLSSPASLPSRGTVTVVADRYEEIDVAQGSGAIEIVRAHDRRLGRNVTIERFARGPATERLWAVRQAVAARGGAGLQVVLALESEGDRARVVLETAFEQSLAERLRAAGEGGALPLATAFEIGAAAARALAPLHEAGVALGGVGPARLSGAPPWILLVEGAPSGEVAPADDLGALWALVAAAVAGHELPDVRAADALARRFAALVAVALPPAGQAALGAPPPAEAGALARLCTALADAARDRASRLLRVAELEALVNGPPVGPAAARAFVAARREAWEIPPDSGTVVPR